ncbi:MAG: hypothetical protein NTY07_00540 [Bacteroidia bacterium]|nr:hypothetical protein [Bacteroidia bacterium]
MKKTLLTIFSILSLTIGTVSAQTTEEFKPSGKPEVLIFTDFNNSTANNKSLNKFEITRAYFGYGYNFSPSLSGRVTLDVGNPGVGSLAYTAFIKFGYLQYQKSNLTVKFGLIGTNGYDVQEKFWGNRYILKSFQDQYGMGPSADFGLSAAYKFSNVISADAIIQNGDGFKALETDSVLKIGVGVTIHPVKELTIRGYYDNMAKKSIAQQTTAFMVGYANKSFNLAAEYNFQADNKIKSGQDFSGYSVYGTLFFNAKTGILARYDYLSSKDNTTNAHSWNFSKDGQQFFFVFYFTPVKGIRISPNYQLWTPKDGSKTNTSSIFMNVEIKI